MAGTGRRGAVAWCAVALATALSGCASMFLNGGHFADGTEKSRVVAKYKVDKCVGTDGSPIQGPDAEYWLLREPSGGHTLAEMDARGEGTVITNSWASGEGDHYFTWVMSSGWEYVIPRDMTKPATRIVYVGLATAKSGNVTKPTSAPSRHARCRGATLRQPAPFPWSRPLPPRPPRRRPRLPRRVPRRQRRQRTLRASLRAGMGSRASRARV